MKRKRMVRLVLSLLAVIAVGGVITACDPPIQPGTCIDSPLDDHDGCINIDPSDLPGNLPGNQPDHRACHLVPNGPWAEGEHWAYVDGGEPAPSNCEPKV